MTVVVLLLLLLILLVSKLEGGPGNTVCAEGYFKASACLFIIIKVWVN